MTEENRTIIAADDDAGALKLLQRMLQAEGYEMLSVSEGGRVLELAQERSPVLFLLDITMPGVDGLELCRRLKRDPRFQRIPVIFLTSRDQTSDLVSGFAAGASDYITKPIKREEVLARVNTHVRLYRSVLELERLNRLALDASPSTGLPGNNSIAAAVSQALARGEASAVLYCDLDNFKAFNDKYGFARGDQVIKLTAQIIQESAAAINGAQGFIGHIGGDDFVVLTASDRAEALARKIVQLFDQRIPECYDPPDAQAGKIFSKNRQGQAQEFPLMTISIGVVDLQARSFSHYLELANACTEVKEAAKAQPGSAIIFDRRKS